MFNKVPHKKITRPLIVLTITLVLSACSQAVKKESDAVQLESRNYAFIDQLLSQDNSQQNQQSITAWLKLPQQENFKPPFPAVVMLHSSWGLSSQEWFYVEKLQDIGIATVVVNSFTSRGIEKTSVDQSLVSSASMLSDAYAALAYIKNNPQLDENRVAVMGFSKGGIAAVYSALQVIQQTVSSNGLRFAAHVAYYPWCGLELLNMQTDNAPILIHGGSKDVVTPVQLCKNLVSSRLNRSDRANITIYEYPAARHAFDHPVLARIPWTVHMDAQIPSKCHIRQIQSDAFYEMSTETQVTSSNLSEVLQQCSSYHGTVKYNRRATQEALHRTIDFLKIHLKTQTKRVSKG